MFENRSPPGAGQGPGRAPAGPGGPRLAFFPPAARLAAGAAAQLQPTSITVAERGSLSLPLSLSLYLYLFLFLFLYLSISRSRYGMSPYDTMIYEIRRFSLPMRPPATSPLLPSCPPSHWLPLPPPPSSLSGQLVSRPRRVARP